MTENSIDKIRFYGGTGNREFYKEFASSRNWGLSNFSIYLEEDGEVYEVFSCDDIDVVAEELGFDTKDMTDYEILKHMVDNELYCDCMEMEPLKNIEEREW